MTAEELTAENVKKKSRNKVIFWRAFIAVLTVAILATIGGVVGYYMSQENATQKQPSPTTTNQSPTTTNQSPTTTSQQQPTTTPTGDVYYVGVGRSDVTGPIVQVNMMGYAHPEQIANGLHTRLYSRAFVISDVNNNSRVAFVSFDGGMTSQLIKLEIVKRLQAKFGDQFTERNVVISGTHTHSGPAGFFQYLLFEMTSLGHVQQSTDAFVDGITRSIEIANSNLQKSRIRIATSDVNTGNINRSPTSYLLNPEAERARFVFLSSKVDGFVTKMFARSRYSHNTEQEQVMVRFDSLAGEPLGMIAWYPVHPTNMNFTNELISSDNKGRASTVFEKSMKKDGETLAGSESFVAAFAQSNQGDVSPRTDGPICVDSGLECEPYSSTCNGTSQNCVASGPGKDMFESTDIIGRRQLEAALAAYDSATEELTGPVSWVHQYLDMDGAKVTLDDGTEVTTCKPGMGYSFAAGCTDGAGAFDFVQGMTSGTPFWNTIRDFLAGFLCTVEPPRSYYNCHKPKPVLLPTGYMDKPYAWHPTIVDVQLLKIGQLIVAAVPGEYSTMAGRRFREELAREAVANGMQENTKVVIAGLSNVYTHYITTPEEYEAQRYEAASTIYGPHTFHVYQQKFKSLIGPLVSGSIENVDPGPRPNITTGGQSPIAPLPAPDAVPPGISFGDVISDVNISYSRGEVVTVKFYGANPRQNMKLGSTYLEVQTIVGGEWTAVFNDADWSTKLKWEEKNSTAPPANITLFSAMFDVIAEITGSRFDLERAMQLHEQEPYLDDVMYDDAIVEGLVHKGRNDRYRKLSELQRKGIIYSESKSSSQKAASVESYVTICWEIPTEQATGTYRIVYHGDHMNQDGVITPFTGRSRNFVVI